MVAMAATLAAVAAATFSAVQWGPSLAQFSGGGTQVEVVGPVELAEPVAVLGEVLAYPPDGGVEVFIPGRVDTSVTNEYVPIGMGATGPKLLAEVSGALGGPVPTTVSNAVEISGYSTVPTVALENGTIVNLGSTSLNTLTATTGKGFCTYVDGDPTATVGTTAANIPASPMANRTAIEIFNHSAAPTNYLLCSAQGTATTTSAVRIESGHQSRKWEGLGGGVLISCKCVTGTCIYNFQEEWCYQQ